MRAPHAEAINVRYYRSSFVFFCLFLPATLAAATCAQSAPPQMHVNSQRLQSTLVKLSEYGRDPAGGIFGYRDGSQKLPVILFGSHIDSVVHGGNYDGDVGSLGAIEVIRALNESSTKTRHPLEVVVWTNEEGNHFGIGTLGSGIAAGLIGPEILNRKDAQGVTFAEWLRRYGQDPAKLTDARIPQGALAASLELHIEQGPTLYQREIPIGVVQGIVAVRRWACVVSGFANHAGTTPMNRRHDALAAAAKDVLAVREVVRGETGTQVGNVGLMKVEPGAANV